MSRLADLTAAAVAAVDHLGRLALIPAAFIVAFAVRIERWYRLIPRAVEAIRSRIAEGGGEQ